jgi:hypothetical protein
VWQEGAAGVGEARAAPPALEERLPELPLEDPDAAAQGRLREVDRPCRPREVAGVGDGEERLEGGDLHPIMMLHRSDPINALDG